LVSGGYWWSDLTSTLISFVLAWLIGCSIGLAARVALGTVPFRTAITPYVIALQALPKIVLAPLFIGWLGFGPPSKIAIAVVICSSRYGLTPWSVSRCLQPTGFKLMQSLNATRTDLLEAAATVGDPMIMVGVDTPCCWRSPGC
jgi:NitT/TauT family transport system permease protein